MENESGSWKKVVVSPKWDFQEVGDKIEGVLMEKGTGGEHNTPTYILENKEGTHTVYGNDIIHTRLQNKEIGTRLLIEFLGKKKSTKSKYHYNDFDVSIWQEGVTPS